MAAGHQLLALGSMGSYSEVSCSMGWQSLLLRYSKLASSPIVDSC